MKAKSKVSGRHYLTPEQRLAGAEKALRNPRTPKQFRKGLERNIAELKKQLGK